jgi:hypothetical protein
MELRRSSSVRLLCRAGAAALLAGAACLAGAPAAGAAEDTPVVALDPPDATILLVPVENLAGLAEADPLGAGSAAADGAGDASAALAGLAALAPPPELAEALGVEDPVAASLAGGPLAGAAAAPADASADASSADAGVAALGDTGILSHTGGGEVDVELGGTLTLRLPPVVQPGDLLADLVVFDDADPEAEPRVFSTDPGDPADQLTVDDLGGNELAVRLPADTGTYGPEALLVVDGLTGTDPQASMVAPLLYYLQFTGSGTGTATVEPSAGVIADVSCPVESEEPCPGTPVTAGGSFDLTVPPTSLLRSFGFGRLDTAGVELYAEDEDSVENYSSEDEGLLTRHDASRATVNVPEDISTGTFYGFTWEGDPLDAGGFAVTTFTVDVQPVAEPVAEPVAVNAGLHSDTGWVEDVREASAGSTKAAAGITMLVVAGLITVVAVAPRRRPPAEG